MPCSVNVIHHFAANLLVLFNRDSIHLHIGITMCWRLTYFDTVGYVQSAMQNHVYIFQSEKGKEKEKARVRAECRFQRHQANFQLRQGGSKFI